MKQLRQAMRSFVRPALAGLGAVLGLAAAPQASFAAGTHAFVVLREHGTGTPSRAQPYLDQLLAVVAKQNQWPGVTGRYFADRPAALAFVSEQKPDFGIFSLSAFLSLKKPQGLSVLGEVVAPKAGGGKYFLLAKRGYTGTSCAGHRVATTFAADAKFVDRVVSGGAFKLADFTLIESHRPLEPLKQVLRGEAECALVDDAQVDAAAHIEGGADLAPIWKSADLPGMAVVAFSRADAGSIASLKRTLPSLCSSAHEACATVGIEQIKPASDDRYRAVLDAYAK